MRTLPELPTSTVYFVGRPGKLSIETNCAGLRVSSSSGTRTTPRGRWTSAVTPQRPSNTMFAPDPA